MLQFSPLACVLLLSCGPVFISRSAQFRTQDRRSCNLGWRAHMGQCVCTQRHTQTQTHRAHKPCFPPCSSTHESDLPTIMLESSKSLKTGRWAKPHTPKGEGQEAGHLLYIRIQAWTLIRTEVQHDTPWAWMGASLGNTAGSRPGGPRGRDGAASQVGVGQEGGEVLVGPQPGLLMPSEFGRRHSK